MGSGGSLEQGEQVSKCSLEQVEHGEQVESGARGPGGASAVWSKGNRRSKESMGSGGSLEQGEQVSKCSLEQGSMGSRGASAVWSKGSMGSKCSFGAR